MASSTRATAPRRATALCWLTAAVLVTAAACGGPEDAGPRFSTPVDRDPVVQRVREPFTGDLDALRERGTLRVLVSFSRTNFFFAGGRAAGFEAELMRQLEEHLNRGTRDPLGRIRVVFVPTPFDRLLDDLLAGRGDVVAAALSVTLERSLRVAFSDPYLPDVEELLVHGSEVEGIETLDDLDGRRVVVRGGSSYAEHARALDRHLRERGGDGLEVVEADPSLATEDLLELVAAGAVELSFADDYMARAWADVLDGLVVRSDVVLHQGVQIAWAVRPGSPQLMAALDAFARTVRRGSTLGNVLFTRYYENIDRRLANPLADDERRRLARMQDLFVRYGEEYGIDWVALAAQAYQESRLDPSRVSPAGAVGVMQLRPSTAAALGFQDIHRVEPNIHAGAKYLARLRDRHFDDEDMAPADRLDFAWAAYNAGPTRIQRLRRLAAQRGFDANRWFGHVEQVAAAEVGREPVDYVRNIVKYYVAYRLYLEEEGERQRSLEILHLRGG